MTSSSRCSTQCTVWLLPQGWLGGHVLLDVVQLVAGAALVSVSQDVCVFVDIVRRLICLQTVMRAYRKRFISGHNYAVIPHWLSGVHIVEGFACPLDKQA